MALSPFRGDTSAVQSFHVLRRWIWLPLLLLIGCRTAPAPRKGSIPEYTLEAKSAWTLRLPAGRFDASALLRMPDGRLLTVNDKEPALFEIRFGQEAGFADLVPVPQVPASHFVPLAAGRDLPWDLEGLGLDERGRIHFCEENSRWILRQSAPNGPLERLPIDWSPAERWFSKSDRNASFEGLAVGGGRIWVANERNTGRIIEVDQKSLRILGDFRVAAPGVTAEDVHYTDLCWHRGELWVLCRELRRVLRVDPVRKEVLASYSYFDLEMDPRHAYRHILPYGFFEGLSVDDDAIWLLVDNNGYRRKSDATDARPQLFRCPRPDRSGGSHR